MHTQKRFLSFAFCFIYLTSTSIALYPQQEPVEQSSLISQEEEEALQLGARFQQIYENSIRLENNLRQIASIIANIKSDVISNTKVAHEFIKQWLLIIEKYRNAIEKTMQSGKDIETIPAQISALADICIVCSQEVTKAMRTNFYEAEFVEPMPNRTIVITLEAIDEQLKLFEEQFKILADNSQCIGLTFTNKVVRKIDDFVSWCGNHHIGKGLALTAGVSALAVYWYWHQQCYKSDLYYPTFLKNDDGGFILDEEGHKILLSLKPSTELSSLPTNVEAIPGSLLVGSLDNSSWSNWFMQKVTGVLGMPPARHADGSFTVINSDKGFLNQIDATINNGLGNKFPPLFYIPGAMLLTKATSIAYNSVIPPMKKAFQSKWNQWRGGAYADKSIEGVWEFIPYSNFGTVIGMEDYKERFEILLDYCMHPEQFSQGNNRPNTNFAFTGPTRTGKTFFANALFGEIKKRLDAIGSPLKYRYLNIPGDVIAQVGVSRVMNMAREMAPCAIFVDEFDLCDPQRGGNRALVIDALTELGNESKNDPLKPIIFIIATNKPENIDTALFTPGRLGEEIRFDYPCIQDRVAFIYNTLQKSAINCDKIDIERLAQKVDGKSFEDMERFITAAGSKARVSNRQVDQQLFEQCIDEVIRRIIFLDRRIIPAHEVKLLSAHFAGEALATMLLQDTNVLDMVTINAFMPKVYEEQKSGTGRPSQQAKILVGKTFVRPLIDTTDIVDTPHTINNIKCWLAGAVAEEIILGYPSSNLCDTGAGWYAFEAAKRLTFGGRYREQMAHALYDKLSLQADELFMQCKQEVKELLEEHREQLDAIAYGLMKYRTLPDYAIAAIMENPSAIYQVQQQTA